MNKCIILSLRAEALYFFFFFFFNDTATTEIYTLSLHDALPICAGEPGSGRSGPQYGRPPDRRRWRSPAGAPSESRSEEHTSELQSLAYLVCRLLLEKKKRNQPYTPAGQPRAVTLTTPDRFLRHR